MYVYYKSMGYGVLTVDVGERKKGLGRYIHEKNITDVAAVIAEFGELETVKKFKTVLASMLTPDIKMRSNIHVVVDKLTQLRSELVCRKQELRAELHHDAIWPLAKLHGKNYTL